MKKNFRTFAKYLKENHLKDLAVFNLENARKMDIPIMKFFAGVPDDILIEQGIQSIGILLTSLEEGTVWKVAQESYKKWKEDKLDSDLITRNDIHPSDIILINSLRKKSFTNFLTGYTRDINEAQKIIEEMDEFFTRSDNESLQVFYEIQKETEARYRESEERYRDLFDNANDLIHIVTIEGNIKYANNSWFENTGYKQEDLPELTIQKVVYPDSKSEYFEKRNAVISGKPSEDFEFSFLTKDGKKIFLEGNITCQFKDGKPVSTKGIFSNITAKKLNEQRLKIYSQNLKESEEKFGLLVENIKDYAIYMLDPDGNIMSWNKGAEKITGYKAKEIIGKHISVLYTHEEQSSKEAEANLEEAKKNSRFEKEGWRIRKDGSKFWANIIYSALYDNEGRLKGFAKVTRDRTEAKNIEEALKDNRQKLQAIFDNAPDAIIVTTMDRVITSWNKASEKLYGYSAEEAIGKNEFKLIPIELISPMTIEESRAKLNKDGSWQGEAIVTTKKGEKIPVSASSTILYDENIKPYGILGINRDISERKKIEDNLQRFAQELIDSEQQIQTILESAPDAVIVIDDNSIIEHWNTRAEEIFGWKSDLIIGKLLHEFIIPERYRKAHIKGLNRFLKTGQGTVLNTTVEIEAINSKGQEFPVALSISPTYVKGKYLFIGFVRDITERKRSDEKIAKTLQSLNEAQQIANIGSWEIDLVTNNIIWSDELYRIFGYEPFEYDALRDLFFRHINPEDAERIIQNVSDAIKSRQSITETYRITTAKGKNRTLIANCNVISNEEGKPVKLSGTVQDITERQEKDDKIAQTLKQLNEAQQMAHIGSWEMDLGTGDLTWSDEMYRIYGLKPFDHNPNKDAFRKYTHPDEREIVMGILENAYKAKQPFNFDYKIIDENGKPKTLSTLGAVVTDRSGKAVKITGTLQDITERREKDDQIAQTLQQLNEAQQMAHIGSWEWDVVSNKINWSDELYRIFGLKPNEFDASFEEFINYIHPEDREMVNTQITKAMENKQPFNFDHRVLRNDGSDRIINAHGVVFSNGENHVIKMSGTAQDVTERVLSKEELKKAEDTVKAKQQFLSNMSHEIRTPMNAIIGFTKVVLKTELSPKQREYLDAIKISGQTLLVLINDILDLAKVDAGKMKFEKIPFKLSSSVSAMIHLFDAKIQEKNLKILKQYDNRIPEVLVGDPVRLHQIILNLISNAVKFTHHGQILVRSSLIEEDNQKAFVKFSVTDTGIGIHEDKLETIFDNFQQASSDTARLYGGTGLGLAIVKQLVEQQGGTISVKSKVQEGTTFTFQLAFLKTTMDAKIDEEEDELVLKPGAKNVKVLVVEDIPLNQLLMKTLLEEFGYEHAIAENGKLAIERLKEEDFDVVLMDLQMPVMNGFEATEFIRNNLRYPNSEIPIIALTADVTTADLEKCTAVGMNDYVAKPINEKTLFTKINRLIKKPFQPLEVMEELIENTPIIKARCINLDYLNQKTKGNSELIQEMIKLYLEQTPGLIKAMRESMENKDWEMLKASVHKIIPSFSIVGIHPEYEEMAKKIQEFANMQEQIDEIHELVLKVEDICLQACRELEEEFKMISPA